MTDEPVNSDQSAAGQAIRPQHLSPPPLVEPWVETAQLEELDKAISRRRRRRRLAWRTFFALTGLAYLFYLAPSLISMDPRGEDLSGAGELAGQMALAHFSSSKVPLELVSTRIELASEVSRDQRLYEVKVVLRLQAPLYVPAFAADSDLSREIQSAFRRARTEVLSSVNADESALAKLSLELPTLVKRSQFAGKEMRVTADFKARRDRFVWALMAPSPELLRPNIKFVGEVLPESGVIIYDEMISGPSLPGLRNQAKTYFEKQLAAQTSSQP